MYVKGIDPGTVRLIVRDVSYRYFAGNLRFTREPEPYRGAVRFTLRVNDSRGPGHRRGVPHSWAGYKPRRMISACYHAYGEVIRALLDAGAAWVKTAPITLERYRNKGAKPGHWTRETFQANAESMAYLNVGSQFSPFCFADACDCEVVEMPRAADRYVGSADWKGPADWPRQGADRVSAPIKVVECGCCGMYHPITFSGDCRDDSNRIDPFLDSGADDPRYEIVEEIEE